MAAKLPRPYGAYVLLKSLGQGAMGDVHLARPINPRRGVPTPIVIKRLHGELATNQDFVRRFEHEATIAVSIDSPHVAKVFDAGSVGESLFITMEFVAGWPLSKFLDEVLNSGRHASVASVIDLIAGGLRGLEALHTAKDSKTGRPLGIVHRDISPKNLMVGDDGLMRLIDLGLGKSNVQDWKTRTGVVMGSVGYMPPEQVAGLKVDARADLFAMGVVCWEMLALRNYIKRAAIPIMLEASMRTEYMPLTRFRPDVPAGLDDVLQRALAPMPENRWQTAREMLDAIRQVVPERKTKGGMVSLLGDLFGPALIEKKAEIDRLLALPLPEDGPEEVHTVIFAERTGVKPLSEEDLSPTRVTAAGQDRMSMNPTAVRTAMRQGPSAPAQTDARAFTPLLTESTVQPPKAGVSMGMLAAAMGITLVVGVAIGSLVVGREPTVVTQAIEVPAEPEPSVASAQPVPSEPAPSPTPAEPAPAEPAPPAEDPGAAAAAAAAAAATKAKAPPSAPKPAKHKPEETPARPAAPRAPEGISVESSKESITGAVKTLLRRAQSLKQSLPPDSPKVRTIDELRVKITMEAGSTDLERAAQKIRELDRELQGLERQP